MPKGKHPAYWLKITDKNHTQRRTVAGAAFVNEFGGLNLVLSPGIKLEYSDEFFITLVPYDEKNPPVIPTARRGQPDANTDNKGGGDDDIPF